MNGWDSMLLLGSFSAYSDMYEGHYTGWPRKNATTLIVNFKEIVNETSLFFILLGRKFIFQQNDTMTINFG